MGCQIFPRGEKHAYLKTYEPGYDCLLRSKQSPGPAQYQAEKSFKHVIKSIQTSFPKATRNATLRLQTTAGPADYETDLHAWKKATV